MVKMLLETSKQDMVPMLLGRFMLEVSLKRLELLQVSVLDSDKRVGDGTRLSLALTPTFTTPLFKSDLTIP
jgi:5-formaminoimidazole-4-carboxamide-1-beta-D-ribofuranosyl 5'-monophosphate synthetase